MGILQTSKAGLDSTLGLIAKRLHSEREEAAHEPLPERWVELIQHLNELERTRDRAETAGRKVRERPPLSGSVVCVATGMVFGALSSSTEYRDDNHEGLHRHVWPHRARGYGHCGT